MRVMLVAKDSLRYSPALRVLDAPLTRAAACAYVTEKRVGWHSHQRNSGPTISGRSLGKKQQT